MMREGTQSLAGLRALIDELYTRSGAASSYPELVASAFFGAGTFGDVVVSANDANFGGIRSYKSLVISAGVTVTLADPLHAIVFRVQNKITIAGTIDGRAQIPPNTFDGDLLVGAQIGGNAGGGGGGGAGTAASGTQGQPGQGGQNTGQPSLGIAQPSSFGNTGNGGAGGVAAVGGDGTSGVSAVFNGLDPLFVQQFRNPFGFSNLVLGGVSGTTGGNGGDGGPGGNGVGAGGLGGAGGAGGNGGAGGAKIYLIAPEIEITATASLLVDGGNGLAGSNGSPGGNAPALSTAGGGGGGSGGAGGCGGFAGQIILIGHVVTVDPSATLSLKGGTGGAGGTGGNGGAKDGAGFVGGKGGNGANGTAGLDGIFSIIPLVYL